MNDEHGLRETFRDFSQARIAPYKNTWKHLQKYIILVQFIACSRKRASILLSKVEYPDMKQDNLGKHKAMHRASWKPDATLVDYRVTDLSITTVQEQDEQRRPAVAKSIEKFESHRYKEQFLKDVS